MDNYSYGTMGYTLQIDTFFCLLHKWMTIMLLRIFGPKGSAIGPEPHGFG